MNKSKDILLVGFTLFSLFFGAGNLLIPPLLGYQAGEDWFLVTIGFIITAVIIPIIGIIAHAKLQGTLFDFGKKVSVKFSFVYCVLIYLIAITIPSPRTAAATHEIAMAPLIDINPLFTSAIYFGLVLIFVLNRSAIVSLIGKFLTPVIVSILLLVIIIGFFNAELITENTNFETPLITGILEGYQTFDAIGAVVVGAVIIISINQRISIEATSKKKLIIKSGLLAGLGLFVIYAGLIATGAYYGSEIELNKTLNSDMQRANLLRYIISSALGNFGNTMLSVLISLACFTTAVGIVTGASDYMKGLFKDSQLAYLITAIFGCVIGIVIGQLDFNSIIIIAVPILLFIYPITIVLIFLNVLPEKYATSRIFKSVVLVTFLFTIPDIIGFIKPSETLSHVTYYIPLADFNLGWVLPALITLMFLMIFETVKTKRS
ncbi:MAG: branched-chain amino acid transport system II carrier protein [Bacteroidota bacterium]